MIKRRWFFIFLVVALALSLVLGSACTPATTATPTTTTPTTTTPTTTTPTTTTPTTTTPTTTTTTEPGVYEIYIYWVMFYSPSFLTVPVGSTVTFILVNGDDPEHPIGFSPIIPFSVSVSGNDIHLTYTFTEPGNYNFFCTVHGDSGLLVVEPEPEM